MKNCVVYLFEKLVHAERKGETATCNLCLPVCRQAGLRETKIIHYKN